MKTRISVKQARSLNPICFGYCEIQNLLIWQEPLFYTAGIYGRRSDIYCIDGIRIETGYATSGDISEIPYEKTRKYEKLSETYRMYHDFRHTKAHNKQLLKRMIKNNTNRKIGFTYL